MSEHFDKPVRTDQMSDVEISYNEQYDAPRVSGDVEAVKAMFQHDRDVELGRWRSPSYPDYVVYPNPNTKDQVSVLHEPSASNYKLARNVAAFNCWTQAAREWFDAHPAKQPWADAGVDEVWLFEAWSSTVAGGHRRALAWMSSEGDWDVVDPRGLLLRGGDPVELLVDAGHTDFGQLKGAWRMEKSDV